MTSKTLSPTTIKDHFWISTLLFAYTMLFSQATFAIQTSISDLHQIQSILNQYLHFDMADENSEICRGGEPDYPNVTGLPEGVYSSGGSCILYGYPETIGTFRVEFPIIGGVWIADIIVTGNDTPPPFDAPPFDLALQKQRDF